MQGWTLFVGTILTISVATGCQLLKSQATGEDASAASTASATTAAPTDSAAADTTGTATATATATGAPKPAAAATPDAGGGGGGGAAACDSIAGTWSTRGTCGPDTCIVTQTGCATNFKCSDGNASYTGQITGKTVSYAGLTATKQKGSCTGTIGADAKTINGTCQGATPVPCAFTATKR